jgi:hypothetical protein
VNGRRGEGEGTLLKIYVFTPVRQYERFGNRALSGLSEGPDSLIKRPNFKIIYNFLIKNKG